jgi:hypothetical protein
MDRRQRRREGSQRAQASRERRQQARAHRKNRQFQYIVGGIATAAVVIAAFFLLQGGSADLGTQVEARNGVHEPPFDYNQNVVIGGVETRIPPSSGNHLATPSRYGFLGTHVIPEAAVHNMEHGAVVIWYQPDDATLAGQVNRLMRDLSSQCLVAGSYTDMNARIAATVWGRVLSLNTFDEAQLRAFIREYRGSEGPEAGVCYQES